MLRQKNRIPRADFTSIIESGKFYQSTHFILRVSLAKEGVKIAVSVSKKVAKSAVVRNTVRRRAYGVIGDLLPTLNTGLYLMSAKRGADKLKGEILRKEILLLLKPFERR
ncbi:MAG: ribonuclease P protein component [Minisyncoccota bacterium]